MDSPIIEKISRDIVSIDLSSDDENENKNKNKENERINNRNIWFNFECCYYCLY